MQQEELYKTTAVSSDFSVKFQHQVMPEAQSWPWDKTQHLMEADLGFDSKVKIVGLKAQHKQTSVGLEI